MMTMHLCVQKLNGEKHPTWDETRMEGDKAFADMVLMDPHELVMEKEEIGPYCWVYRPNNFEDQRDRVRNLIISGERPLWKRHLDLIDLLEREPDYWLFVSQ